jgi:hypothetical protein
MRAIKPPHGRSADIICQTGEPAAFLHHPLARRLPWSLWSALGLSLTVTLALALSTPSAAQAKSPAPKAEASAQTEAVEISGRIIVGQDKVFIKDGQGYCLVRGLDLTPYAGRNIQAKGLVIHKDQEYRTVRLLEYRISSPDDDSPGAGGEIRQTSVTGKKKK